MTASERWTALFGLTLIAVGIYAAIHLLGAPL